MKVSLTVLNSKKGASKKLLILFLTTMLALAIVILIAFKKFGISLERENPIIRITNVPKGLGAAPAHLELELEDKDSGLDEVVIRTIQKKNTKIIKKEKLNGQKNFKIDLLLNGKESGITEGKFEVEIKAFDRSVWSNKSLETLGMTVDYAKPSLSPVTTQHNIQLGGSQLAIYQASDEQLGVSGVRVGNRLFEGFPASGLDPDFEQSNYYISIFAIRNQEDIKLFSEDKVGNTNSKPLYFKLFNTPYPKITWNFNEASLREIVNTYVNSEELKNISEEERLTKGFKLVFEDEKSSDSNKVEKILIKTKPSKLWSGNFIQPTEGARTPYGATIDYKLNGISVGTGTMQGYEFTGSSDGAISASNSGIVIYSGELGTYGKTVIIDHGLGIASVYAYLSSIGAKAGVKVSKGEKIGEIGNTGISRGKSLLFELRIQGVPVDAREWWSPEWYKGHLAGKLKDAKYNLGINNTDSFD